MNWEYSKERHEEVLNQIFENSSCGQYKKYKKVDKRDIDEIKRLRKDGLTYREIGEIFGYDKITIGSICRNKYYKN